VLYPHVAPKRRQCPRWGYTSGLLEYLQPFRLANSFAPLATLRCREGQRARDQDGVCPRMSVFPRGIGPTLALSACGLMRAQTNWCVPTVGLR
jgi:hypothetical protein